MVNFFSQHLSGQFTEASSRGSWVWLITAELLKSNCGRHPVHMFQYFNVKHEGLVGHFSAVILMANVLGPTTFSFQKVHQMSNNYAFDLKQLFANLSLDCSHQWLPWESGSVAVTIARVNWGYFFIFLSNEKNPNKFEYIFFLYILNISLWTEISSV